MDGRTSLALRLSYDLAGATDREAFLDAMIESLEIVFPADSLGWAGAHLATHAAELRGTNDSDRAEIVHAVGRTLDRHPIYLSYLDGDITPRRMSDLIGDREWRDHPVYHEVFVPLGATRQLTIVVAPVTVADWHGWSFHRAHDDFTDTELQRAIEVQPMLIAFDRLTCLAREAVPTDHRDLTDRQAQILQLVAQGFTAVDISYILRISPLTVRKHLEHVYEKLGEHDRLRAVSAAVQAGIIHR